MQRQRQQQIVLPNPDQIGSLVLRSSVAFARRNPVLSASYFFGILLLIVFGGGGRPLTAEQHSEYHRLLQTVDLQAEYQATTEYSRSYRTYQASRGWLWGCDAICTQNYQNMRQAEQIMQAIQKEGAARTADAKNAAGLFSEIGIGEVQDAFWGHFHAGKQFAKRQTMWDMMFIGIRSMSRGRDESWIEFAIKVLMQVLLNLSMGLVMALVFFVVGLWTIVRSYQPNPLVAVLFFAGAAIAAFSFVVTYLLAVYGAAAGGVYTVLKVAEGASQARIAEQQRQRVQQGRPHYD